MRAKAHNSARYLLRFDDLCPAWRLERWEPLFEQVQRLGICPVLAAIPQNEDPELMRGAADPDFWTRLRALEAAGASIGLHGYRHLSLSRGRSLVPLHRVTEFAGAELATQRAWIHRGLEILRGHGLHPALWVAPRHGFDRATLQALREEGLGVLSDGFARRPFVRDGVTWLPQQLWAPVEQRAGLWTLCIHPETATEAERTALCRFLETHAPEFVSVEQALKAFPPVRYGLRERLEESSTYARIQASRGWKRLRATMQTR